MFWQRVLRPPGPSAHKQEIGRFRSAPRRGQTADRKVPATARITQPTRHAVLLAGLVALLSLAGCASLHQPNPPPGGPATSSRAIYQEGTAAYYAARFDGQRTASGERFDSRRLTAAHRELPLGTRVQVTNLDNDRTVTVRINDRGPYTPGRIIDLSRAAARRLDMIDQGVAPVALRVVR